MDIGDSADDRRALKILHDTYWADGKWRDYRSDSTPPPEDLEYAKRAGVMFENVKLTHDDVMRRALVAVHAVERQTVADAFVHSLSSHRLELRSALGSFAVLQHFAQHEAHEMEGLWCAVCGCPLDCSEREDLSVLNFERHKWGGVRHSDPLYAALDLELFVRLPHIHVAADDVRLFQSLLRAIEAAPPETSSSVLEKHIGKVFKSNKAERDIVIGILGLCGILATPAHPGFLQRFIPYSDRTLPPRRFVDMAYPACWWRRTDGINREAVAYWFAHLR
jgi:hypothetical protein